MAVAVVPTAQAAPAHRNERVVDSLADDGTVIKSYVEIYSPLPAAAPAHPAACDYTGYIRYRDSSGPSESSAADVVFSALPGLMGGADGYDPTARSMIKQAHAAGKHAEYWVISRRSNCFNDRTGLDAGTAAHDYRVALDYYYNGKSINGKTFQGWTSWSDARAASYMGYGQMINDWRTIIVDGIPDPAQRTKKMFCGGHSAGGLTLSALAAWDFDGNPATTEDAGYNLCGGFVALDTVLMTDPVGLHRAPALEGLVGAVAGVSNTVAQFAGANGVLPNFDLKVLLSPETFTLLGIAALAAYFEPDKESELMRQLPHNLNIDTMLRISLSRDHAQLITNVPDVRSFRYTNAAFLGAVVDDNSQAITLLQTNMGSFAGGPVAEKSMLVPESFGNLPIVGSTLASWASGRNKVAPTDPHALYTWRNYDEPALPRADGVAYSLPQNEVTDIRDAARMMFEGPTTFLDAYYPFIAQTQLTLFAGARTGELAPIQHLEGPFMRPNFTVFAGDGVAESTMGLLNPVTSVLNPQGHQLLPTEFALAPGYQHIDILMAAPKQNNGRPEISSTALTTFLLEHAQS